MFNNPLKAQIRELESHISELHERFKRGMYLEQKREVLAKHNSPEKVEEIMEKDREQFIKDHRDELISFHMMALAKLYTTNPY